MSTVDPNTTGQVPGQTVTPARPTTPAPNDAGELMQAIGGMLTPALSHIGALLQSQGVDNVDSTKGQTTIEKAQDNSALLTGATQGMSITNPQLPTPDHATLEKAIEKIVFQVLTGQDPFEGAASPELVKLALTLMPPALKELDDFAKSASASKSVGSARGAEDAEGSGNIPLVPIKIVALAALGGLTAVSLFEILSKFAKTQADTEKMASELTVKLHKAEIEGAKAQASIVEEKAAIAVAALITQMIVGVAAAGLQIGGGMHAMRPGVDPNLATIENTLWGASSQMASSIGDKGTEAIKTMMTAPLEAQEIMLRAYNEQIQKASQSTDKMGDDAHSLVNQALELLKQMLSALAQSFNKIGH